MYRLLCLALLFSCGGCETRQGSQTVREATLAEPLQSAEDVMFDLVSKECVYYALKNVDRPFEAKVEPVGMYIDPSDPSVANATLYVTYGENGKSVRRLFLVMLENTKAPAYAVEKGDLTCLLVNCDGNVLQRDDEFFDGMDDEALEQTGAKQTDGPPFLAEMISKTNGNP